MKIILVRHGQTVWNEKQIFRGRADVPLDETGVKQAMALAEALEKYKIGRIFSSPLQRALETARISGEKLKLNAVLTDGLTELDCGRWQGLALEKVQSEFPEAYQEWLENPQAFAFPDGESLSAVRKRVSATLSQILDQGNKGDLLIVSHRAINKIILCCLLSLDNTYFWKFKQDLGAIHALDLTDGYISVSALNDTRHLEGMVKKDSLDF